MNKVVLAIKGFSFFRFTHRWIIPILHATLWVTGLFFTLQADSIFSYDCNRIKIIQFLTIFVILFLEVMITLLDLYVSRKAYYLASTFILFTILILIVVIGTAISAGFAFVSGENFGLPLLAVLLFSSSLKLIETLLVNNQRWYIVTNPNIIDACGIYINRTLV